MQTNKIKEEGQVLSGTLKVSRDKQLINWTEGYVNVMSVGELVDRPIIKQSMVR